MSVYTVLAVGSVSAVDSVFSVYTILAVSAVYAVGTFQCGKVVQVQPYFVADIMPLQGVFAYTEFRRFSVCPVLTVLSGGACNIGYRNKVLPLVALVTPLYVGFGSLHLYAFAVNSVLSVGAVFTGGAVNAVFSVGAVQTVHSVLTVDAILAVGSVLSVFSGSPLQLGKGHQVVPVGFIAVFPLDRRAVIAHLRQCGVVGFCRLAPSYGKHAAKHQ